MKLTPIPHEEATRSIAEKPALTRAVWDRLHPDLQARAYTISGVECLDAIARVRELTARLPSGGDYAELKSQILSEISPWLVDPTADDATQAKQSAAAKRRAEMLLRLHGWSAYAQTNHALAEAHIDVFPYRQYLSSEDSRVRPSHAALNKKILPATHPFWANHTPPWEFNCRCDFAVMTEEEAQGIGAREKSLPDEDKKLMPPSQLRLMEEQNIIVKPGAQGFLDIRTPRQKGGGKGYEFRPGDNALPLNQILERFTPSERSTFQAWSQTVRLANGVTLAEYWGLTAPTAAPAASTTELSASLVSSKFTPNRNTKQLAITALAVIDRIHTDGPLPVIPVHGSPDKDCNGHYNPNAGRREIAVRMRGQWPANTLAHEIGHFLDHMGMGTPGTWESDKPDGILKDVIASIKSTPTFANIKNGVRASKVAYYESNKELWARAYSQYIATKSQDPTMLAGLDKARSLASFIQWPDDEFEPIAKAIDDAFASIGWITPTNL